MSNKKDNSTLRLKCKLRQQALRLIEKPVILETHGGFGKIWYRCYSDVPSGVVFEKDPRKSDALAEQRPTWAVYECDVLAAVSQGVGFHLPINFIDLDPYGEPWPIIEAIFKLSVEWPTDLVIVVNDGLRHKLTTGSAWHVHSLRSVVKQRGNDSIYKNYLEVCRALLADLSSRAGYRIKKWSGYYCGDGNRMTHYAALLQRTSTG